MVAAGDEARRRIQRDLHDGAQPRLVQTVITLKLAQRADGRAHADLVQEALEQAEAANEALHELVRGILPATMSQGLRAAVESLVSHLSLPVSVDIAGGRQPELIERTAYFVVAEALANVMKHAGATRAAVHAVVEDGALRVRVSDDGAGGADPRGGTGLTGLIDRVEAVGGTLAVESPPGAGTTIRVELPLT
jgi:signal transduction histidine kinase